MLFKTELAEQIVLGKKTQTRRPIKTGEMMSAKPEHNFIKTVLAANGRVKWQQKKDYAVQYGRGLPTCYWHENEGLMDWVFYQTSLSQTTKFHEIAKQMGWKPLRIRILDIWAEDVREISHEDSKFEGFSCADEFLCIWADFYDKKILAGWFEEQKISTWVPDGTPYAGDVVPFADWLITNRPDSRYQAWALKFEVVK